MINKLKWSYKTIWFWDEWVDKNWDLTIKIQLIWWVNINNKQEIRLFKNNNSNITHGYIVIAKEKIDLDLESTNI